MSIITTEHWCYVEFFYNQDKSYFHTDKIQYLYYLNLILANGPLKTFLPQGSRLRLGWALSSYATVSAESMKLIRLSRAQLRLQKSSVAKGPSII